LGKIAWTFERYRDAAIKELSDFFIARKGSRILTQTELTEHPSVVAGWSTPISVNGKDIPIKVLVDERLPFSLPRLYLFDKTLCLQLPHIDRDGFICVVPGHTTATHVHTEALIKSLLSDAERIISSGEELRDDFTAEFHNYWRCQDNLRDIPFWSLVRAGGPSRKISFFKGREYTLFSDTAANCRAWMSNRLGVSAGENAQIGQSMLIWLDKPLLPENYPTTNKAIGEMAKEVSQETYNELIQEISQNQKDLPVLIGFDTANGPALAGVVLQAPVKGSGRKGDPKVQCVSDGFRKGMLPNELLATRYLTDATKLIPVKVKRADSDWIHFRSLGKPSDMHSKKVAIIGCGSLGADVAYILAKSGVGNLVLIDGDTLEWENVGRHLLGGREVGLRKDVALRNYLIEQLPHLSVTTFEGLDSFDFIASDFNLDLFKTNFKCKHKILAEAFNVVEIDFRNLSALTADQLTEIANACLQMKNFRQLLQENKGSEHVAEGADEKTRKQNKQELHKLFPKDSIKYPETDKWQPVFSRDEHSLLSADLIITTTGSWAAESPLNVLSRSVLDFPPVIFGWIEPFGCAGHSLAVMDSGGCLGCGMNELGHFSLTATVWPKDTIQRAAACSDFFQPYGVVNSAPVKTMISEMAIDVLKGKISKSELRTWLSKTEHLHSLSGNWHPELIKQFGDPGNGSITHCNDWGINPNCELCK